MRSSLLVVALGAALATAKTDLGGCVSSQTTNQYHEASMLWYVPGTGEICEILDCGGGRAPVKTTVPGCAAYKGTATYSPQYLTGYNGAANTQASSAVLAGTTSSPAGSAHGSSTPGSVVITAAPTTTPAVGAGSSTLATSTGSPAQSSKAPAGANNGTSVVAPSGNSTGNTPSSPSTAPSSTPNAAAGTFVPGAMGALAAAFAFLL